jgi:cytochrome c556
MSREALLARALLDHQDLGQIVRRHEPYKAAALHDGQGMTIAVV